MKQFATRVLPGAVLLLCLASMGGSRVEAGPAASSPCCNLVAQSLKDYSSIKAGGKRSDLELFFRESAGMSFGNPVVYVYKKCPYIQVTVTFTSPKNSPADVIAAISKLSIDYEAKD